MSRRAPLRHMESPAVVEYSLCGLAIDAFESGDSEAPVVFATPQERVTCPLCLKVIAACKKVRWGKPAP